MRRRWAVLFVTLASLAPWWPPAGATGEPFPDFIALNPRGTARNTSTDPAHLVFTVDLFSLASGEKVGTLTDDITCSAAAAPPCLVFDIVTTYRLPGGDIVNHGYWSGVPDPQRSGFILAGTRPDRDTIVSGTGRFEGRTGRATGWGTVDGRRLPDELGYDMFTVIRLDPADAGVVGSSELLGRSGNPPGFRAQHFRSDGSDGSPDPAHIVATAELLSLAVGTTAGTAIDDISCSTSGAAPCPVLDVLTVFRFPDGEITARSAVSVVPDPQRPGFGLVGTRPERDTIVSGTGAYAGRTGRLRLSGSVDLRRFPAEVPYEGISVISFD